MEESFKSRLKHVLQKNWEEVLEADDGAVFHPILASNIRTLLHSDTKTYRYPVVTQLLAKLTDPALDTRCIQATRTVRTEGNFDARSVCHEVVVPWEFANQSPLGGSGEPYINNPLRVPEFSSDYRAKQKNKAHWDLLIELFEYIESNPTETKNAFLQALIEVRRLQQALLIEYPIPLRLSLFVTLQCIKAFLNKKSGGERLQLMCYALMFALMEHSHLWDEVKTSKINASDASERKPADIVCLKKGEIVLAVEVKDQDLTLELLESAIKTARIDNVKELMAFVSWKNPDLVNLLQTRIQTEFANGMNVYVVNAEEFLSMVLVMVGENGRRHFIEGVCKGMETMNCAFQTKKEWAKILSEI